MEILCLQFAAIEHAAGSAFHEVAERLHQIGCEHGVAAIGSGGNYALAAARVLVKHTQLDARVIAEEAMKVAAGICVYTNEQLTFEELP